jgi:molecular chaperone GrpE
MRKKDQSPIEVQRDLPIDQTGEQDVPAADTADTVPVADTAPASDTALAAEELTAALKEKEEQFLRLAAEYDNFRRRSQKEKESIWADAKSETALAFLSVYDNLERALKQETTDAAYAKGVEMTMTGLKEVLSKLDIEEISALGQPFDPNLHNAVVHTADESVGENTVVEVFQTGFRSGEKVIRFSMVKVAN